MIYIDKILQGDIMKITRRQLRLLIRESLEQLTRGYPAGLDSFDRIQVSPWNDDDLRQEFSEEVADLSGDDYEMSSEEYIAQRWPHADISTLDFMQDPDAFIAKAKVSPIVDLPVSKIKQIHNHAQVHDVIQMYEKGLTPEQIKKSMIEFFSPHETQADASGKVYNKAQSYLRWVKEFAKTDLEFNKPPILLHSKGHLMHIGGQTRQVGALTNRKILPYLVLDADNP